MSFANLTGLNIGTSGTLSSKRFTVVGRVVMGMEEEGETYRWNEFHLVDEANQSAILVYEVTERGAQWKLFTYVESSRPWTADEAAAKRVGETVDIDGAAARITLIDESKVCSIEGRPPEGVEVGDMAKYFNAMAGNRMYVVSWTGTEVEIFCGVDLPTHAVASAFNLRQPLRPLPGEPIVSDVTDRHAKPRRWIVTLFAVAAVIGAAVGSIFSCRSSSPNKAKTDQALVPVKPPTPAAPLVAGVSGQLWGKPWRVAGHALVEVRTPGSIYERHEYHLVGDNQATALLVYGLDVGKQDWWLLQPAQFDTPLTPVEAAAKRAGNTVNVLKQPMVIQELFLSTVRSAEGELASGLASGAVAYNFRADGKGTVLLARWTETGISCHVGKLLPAIEVTTGFP